MENIHVDLGAASYDIEIEKGLLDRLGTSVRQLTRAEKIAIVTDDTVDPLYGERLEKTLAHSGIEACRIAFPAAAARSSRLLFYPFRTSVCLMAILYHISG